MAQPEKHLIVIAGATASGKTGLAVQLAQHIDTEVISADSRQFYREMHIGTARPTAEEMQGVPHHFVGHIGVEQAYSAGQFERDALELLTELFTKYNVVIMAGGSGLYINAVCHGIDEFEAIPAAVRSGLNEALATNGLAPLLEELKNADPAYHNEVDRNNPRRIVRALEVIRHTGQPYSSFRKQTRKKRPFSYHKLGLHWEREALYARINQRVDAMLAHGLEAEARSLYGKKHLSALQTVGYSELFQYLDEQCSLPEAVEKIKQNTRRYAKRQGTWFRKDTEIQWLNQPFFEHALTHLKNAGVPI